MAQKFFTLPDLSCLTPTTELGNRCGYMFAISDKVTLQSVSVDKPAAIEYDYNDSRLVLGATIKGNGCDEQVRYVGQSDTHTFFVVKFGSGTCCLKLGWNETTETTLVSTKSKSSAIITNRYIPSYTDNNSVSYSQESPFDSGSNSARMQYEVYPAIEENPQELKECTNVLVLVSADNQRLWNTIYGLFKDQHVIKAERDRIIVRLMLNPFNTIVVMALAYSEHNTADIRVAVSCADNVIFFGNASTSYSYVLAAATYRNTVFEFEDPFLNPEQWRQTTVDIKSICYKSASVLKMIKEHGRGKSYAFMMSNNDDYTTVPDMLKNQIISQCKATAITPELYTCWKFTGLVGQTEEEYRRQVNEFIQRYGIPAVIDAVCRGCVAVIMHGPRWMWWYLTAFKDEISTTFGSDLRSMSQIGVNNVTELKKRKDNVRFRESLSQLCTEMINHEVPEHIPYKLSIIFESDKKHSALSCVHTKAQCALCFQGLIKLIDDDYQGALEDFNRAHKINPNDAPMLRSRGDTKRMLKDTQGALEDFNRADEIEPNDAFTLRSRGETKRMLGDLKGALEDFNRADKINPNDAFTLCSRGDTKRMLEDYQGALEDLIRADEIEPNNAGTLRSRGETKRMLEDYHGALEDLNRADEIEPNDAFTLCYRGETKRMLEDYHGALEDLNRADKINPNDAFTLHSRGETKRMLEDYQGALKDFNRADEIEPNDAFTLCSRGDTKRILGDLKGALEDFNRADEIEPNDAFTLCSRGETKRMLGDLKGALEDFNRADEIEPNDAFTLCYRGETKRMLEDYHGALEDFNRADEIEPNDAFTLCSRGETKRMLEDYQGELEDFNRADELQPNKIFTLYHLGETKRMLGDLQGALEDFNRAHKINPNDALMLRSRAETKRMLEDYHGALEDLNRADEFQPNDGFTLRSRGETKRMLGDLKGALKDFNRAHKINPNDAFTLHSRGETKRMLGDLKGVLEDFNRLDKIVPNEAIILRRQRNLTKKIFERQLEMDDDNHLVLPYIVDSDQAVTTSDLGYDNHYVDRLTLDLQERWFKWQQIRAYFSLRIIRLSNHNWPVNIRRSILILPLTTESNYIADSEMIPPEHSV